jgi:transposase
MTAVAITRTDMTSAQLRAAAGREKDGAAARRILALALVLEGTDRTTAAKTCGMDRQTLRDWVHRYNNEGLAGLRNRKPSGRPSSLTAQQKAVLCQLVEQGPDPAVHKVVRWRRRDLAAELERRFGVKLHERSVGDLLVLWAIVVYRCAHATLRLMKRRKRHLKKLCRDDCRQTPRPCQGQANRNLVPG